MCLFVVVFSLSLHLSPLCMTTSCRLDITVLPTQITMIITIIITIIVIIAINVISNHNHQHHHHHFHYQHDHYHYHCHYAIFHLSSVESQTGTITVQRCSIGNHKDGIDIDIVQ